MKFPKPLETSTVPENYNEADRLVKEMKWKKDKMLEDMKREQAILEKEKSNFEKKKQEFLKFLAESSSYATQVIALNESQLTSICGLHMEVTTYRKQMEVTSFVILTSRPKWLTTLDSCFIKWCSH